MPEAYREQSIFTESRSSLPSLFEGKQTTTAKDLVTPIQCRDMTTDDDPLGSDYSGGPLPVLYMGGN